MTGNAGCEWCNHFEKQNRRCNSFVTNKNWENGFVSVDRLKCQVANDNCMCEYFAAVKKPPRVEPCPFCGSLDLEVIVGRHPFDESEEVKCNNCLCFGPPGMKTKAAIRLWNNRKKQE